MENTSSDSSTASVAKTGPSSTTTAGLSYTVQPSPNLHWWWIRHALSNGQHGGMVAFNANPKNVAEGCVQ
jgi:hypothetical protein